jgi:predicted phosphodiesterase
VRIGLFSDVHSNYHALEAVLADIDRRGVDRLICLGDVTMKGPLPKECVDRVRDLGCPVLLGNTDSAYQPERHPSNYLPRNQTQVAALADFERHTQVLSSADQLWLASLPMTLTEVVEGAQLEFFHATPTDNYVLTMPWAPSEQFADLRMSAETAVAAFGHSHRPFVRFPPGWLAINTGSVGAPYDGDWRASYVILELENGATSAQLLRVPFDQEAAIQAAQDAGMVGWELFAHTVRTGRFAG